MEGFDSGGSIGKAPQFGENSTGSVRFHLLSFCRFFFFFWLCSYNKSGVFFFPLEFCDAEDTVFDASQYAFFGKDVVEEVELGGLEDEEDNLPAPAYDEEEFLFDKEEVYCFSGLLC